jgi:hypothetical protein
VIRASYSNTEALTGPKPQAGGDWKVELRVISAIGRAETGVQRLDGAHAG